MHTSARGLIDPYLGALGTDFHVATAPTGVEVLSTPFRYSTGGPVEIACWRENGDLMLSDRGGACDSLLAAGQDPLESPAVRGQVEWVAESHGAFLSGDAITRRVASQDIGPDVRAVVQAALDAQAMGLRVGASGGADAEPAAYDTVRRILEERDARYIEHAVVLGTIGRKYRVDFKAAVMASPKVVVRAAIVVIHSSPLEMAERWNFRFRDMGERPRRKRVAVIDGATAWSPDARRTLAPECDGLFGPGDTDGLRDYLARVA